MGMSCFRAEGAESRGSFIEWKGNSVLSDGKWVKVKTTGKGIHKIPYDKLKSWGFARPEAVNVYGNGGYKLTELLDEIPVDDLTKNRSWHGRDGSGKDCLFSSPWG